MVSEEGMVFTMVFFSQRLLRGVILTPFMMALPLSLSGVASGAGSSLPIQDGAVLVGDHQGDLALAFPYIPFLETSPSWNPALPTEYGQSPEPVTPLRGLSGVLHIEVVNPEGEGKRISWEGVGLQESEPYHWQVSADPLHIEVIAPLDKKGALVELTNTTASPLEVAWVLDTQKTRTPWATPQKKDRRDWGFPVWEVSEDLLLQSYSLPLDASRSPHTAFWMKNSQEWKTETPDEGPIRLTFSLPPNAPLTFGFTHGDNPSELENNVSQLKTLTGGSALQTWKDWRTETVDRIQARHGNISDSTSSEVVVQGLCRVRSLFLSNGAILDRPLSFEPIPVSLQSQAVAVHHWKALGLDFPFLDRWAELVLNNPFSERSLPVRVFHGNRIREVVGRGGIPIVAPDPENPPSKEEFLALIGSVIDLGKVTLVDGVTGFRGKEGWWTQEGCQDLAEYAFKVLGVEIHAASSQVLDATGLAEDHHTLFGDIAPLARGESETPVEVAIEVPKKQGFLVVYPSKKNEESGALLSAIDAGGNPLKMGESGEEEILAASDSPRFVQDSWGNVIGRGLHRESFVAYDLGGEVSHATLTLSGDYTVTWAEQLPPSEVTLVKKAFQEWYLRELLTVPIPRKVHAAVYGATWSARIFDVTGTGLSPVIYHRFGKGSLVWVGLPREYLLRGSDRGTDAQHSLRSDPGYDLLRVTLALHDPDRAGGQQASAPPNAWWLDGYNQQKGSPSENCPVFFALLPTRILGPQAGGALFWGNFFSRFSNALEHPEWEGQLLNDSSLVVEISQGEGETASFAANAFRMAAYREIAKIADRNGATWWNNTLTREAGRIEEDLVDLFLPEEGKPALARTVQDGSVTGSVVHPHEIEAALLTLTEIPAETFPGGTDARDRFQSHLSESFDPHGWSDQALALWAVLEETHRSEIVDSLLNRWQTDPEAFDIDTLAPLLHAWGLVFTEKTQVGSSQ
jgi:hypothetical protein